MLRTRRLFAATAMALALAGGTLLLAQDPAKEKEDAPRAASPAAPRRKYDPSRRVPDHFGQVGLTIEQREAIYKIRKTHQDRIDALKKEIADAEAKSMGECEAVLTETQKKILENLRVGAGRTAAGVAAAPAAKK